MRLDPNSWHVKWYFTATMLFEAFKGSMFLPEFGSTIHTNLCPYVRRMLVTFPLLLVFYASIVWFAFYSIIYYPATHIGWPYFMMIGITCAIIGGAVAVIAGIIWAFPSIAVFWDNYIGGPLGRFFGYIGDRVGDCIMGEPDAPSFCAVLRQWLIDRHHMICRDLTIGEETTP